MSTERKVEKAIKTIEEKNEEVDKKLRETEEINKKMEELEKKEKLSWKEKWLVKRLVKRLKRTIEMIEKGKRHADKTEKELKQIITKSIMQLDDIFEMTEEDGTPLSADLLMTKDVNELLQIMKEGTKELAEIVGEEA